MPRSRKGLPLSEKLKVLKETNKKKMYAEAANIYSKNEYSIRKTVKEKEIPASFAVLP